MRSKYDFIRLSVLLSLTVLVMFLSSKIAWADPPGSPPLIPPTPVWEKREPIFPPPEREPWSPSISAQGVIKTFYAVADAEVRQGNPAVNYGIEPTMGAGYDNYTSEHRLKHRALLDFNTTTYLPPGTVIHQATLRLYMAGYCDAYSTSYQAYRIGSSWLEMEVTWNNQPPFAEGYGSRLISASSAWGYYNFDVTNLVKAWANGSYPEYGIMIRGPESPSYACAFRDFLSKGGGGFTASPELIVDYTLPTPALSVSQNDVVIFHQCGVGNPAPQPKTVEVKSNNTTLYNWTTTLIGGSGWLNVDKTNGKVSRIFPDQIELSLSETGDCPDTQTAQIQVNATGLGSQTINVTFQQSQDPLNLVHLPLILKNGGGGLPGNNTSINPASTANRIILLIGVADYQNLPAPAQFSVLSMRQSNKTQDLLAPRADVGGMEDSMEMAFGPPTFPCGGGLSATTNGRIESQASCGCSIISLPEEYATKANVDYALEWIDEREDANSEVLIYYSGHGGPIGLDTPPIDELDGTDEMFGVYDTSFNPTLTNPVIDDDFKARLANLETEHLAVILDSCNSGGMEVTHPHRAVLAASQENQSSWESAELEHGVFTYYMLQAMQNPASDTNRDCWISVQEIYNYANSRVYNYIWNKEGVAQNLYINITTDVKVVPISGCSQP